MNPLDMLTGGKAADFAHPADPAYLAAYLSISETVKAYTHAIDRRDWATYRSLFGDTLIVDYKPRQDDIPTGEIAAEKWVLGAKMSLGKLEATYHHVSTYKIEIDGETAVAVSYYDARHFEPKARGGVTFTQHGEYTHHLRREDGRWLITEVHARVLFAEGNATILLGED